MDAASPPPAGVRIAVRLELDSGDFAAGEPVRGSLEVSNPGTEPVTLAAPYAAAALSLVVFDRQWRVVAPDPVGKVHAPYETFRLEPGESRRFPLHGLRHLTGTSAVDYRLEPGEYRVMAVYHPPDDRLPERSAYPVVACSAPVPVRVSAAGEGARSPGPS